MHKDHPCKNVEHTLSGAKDINNDKNPCVVVPIFPVAPKAVNKHTCSVVLEACNGFKVLIRTKFPIEVRFAVTADKSQGATSDKVV